MYIYFLVGILIIVLAILYWYFRDTVSGSYADSSTPGIIRKVTVSGNKFSATDAPDGIIEGNNISISAWNVTGVFDGERIKWNNGVIWLKK